MISKEQIIDLVNTKLHQMDCFLVDVKVSMSNDITIFFDNLKGVDMNDCLEMSRFIEKNLDREIEDYNLSVSSPGAFSPFLVEEQFFKNINKSVSVKLTNGLQYSGLIKAYNESLEIEVKEKKGVQKIISIKKQDLKEVKRKINFK